MNENPYISYIDKIDMIIKDAEIKKTSQMHKISYTIKDGSWVKELAHQIANYQYDWYMQTKTSDISCFSTELLSSNIEKYFCLFPYNNIVPVSKASLAVNDIGRYYVNRDFIDMFLQYKELIKHGIVNILPTDISTPATDELFSDGSPSDIRKRVKITYISEKRVGDIYIKLPWLYGVSTNDYIEIIQKNSNEFKNYRSNLSKVINAFIDDDTRTINNYLYDLKESSIQIQIEFEKAKRKLYSKGAIVILGMFCTVVPLLLPDTIPYKEIVSTVLGATSVKEIIESTTDFTEIKNIGRENPFYITWKWKDSKK